MNCSVTDFARSTVAFTNSLLSELSGVQPSCSAWHWCLILLIAHCKPFRERHCLSGKPHNLRSIGALLAVLLAHVPANSSSSASFTMLWCNEHGHISKSVSSLAQFVYGHAAAGAAAVSVAAIFREQHKERRMAKASAQRMLAYVRLLQGNPASALSAATQALQVGALTCPTQILCLAVPCSGQPKLYHVHVFIVTLTSTPFLNCVF